MTDRPGRARWHSVRPVTWFGAWSQVTLRGAALLGVQWTWTVCRERMDAPGWVERREGMSERGSVEVEERDNNDSAERQGGQVCAAHQPSTQRDEKHLGAY